MAKPPSIVGLELGERSFVCAVGMVPDPGRLIVQAAENIPARGMERGVLTDPVECTDTIARLVRQVEKNTSQKITQAFVAMCGNHLKSSTVTSTVPIPDPTVGISRRDIDRAIAHCKTLSLEYDRQILHTSERRFSIDGQSGIKDPVGLSGTKLRIDLHLVTAQTCAVQNLTRVLHRAGVEVSEFVVPILAMAEAVLADLDRDLGVTLISIGEFQTEAVLFTDGAVRETFLFPWGIDYVAETLSRSLKLPRAAVDQLLDQLKTVEERPERAQVPLHVKAGSIQRTFSQGEVIRLVVPKVKELLGRIKRQLDESSFFQESAAGITMCGRLALLEGFLEIAEGILNMPVRLGTSRDVEVDTHVSLNSAHTTAIGLLHYATKRRVVPAPVGVSGPPWVVWVDRTRKILEEYF